MSAKRSQFKRDNSLAFRMFALRRFGCCQWCGRRVFPGSATTDHIIPVIRGGGENWKNLCLACEKCNVKKDSQLMGRPPFGPADWSEVARQEGVKV